MIYISKNDTQKIVKELSKNNTEKIKEIIRKLSSPKKNVYVTNKKGIKSLIQKAFNEKRSLKIKYYSLSSDEVKWRVINVLKIHRGCIIAYCHLREEERNFVTDRIHSAVILDEKYNIPNNWSPESIILDK